MQKIQTLHDICLICKGEVRLNETYGQ